MANMRQRGENSWEFTVSMGKGSDNKYDRRYKTIEVTEKMSPKKLQDYLDFEYAKFKQELETGEYITPGKRTFKEFIELWRDSYAKSNLSPTTLDVYNGHIDSRLIPKFGHMKLDQIKPGLILEFLKDLEKPGARKSGNMHKKQTDEHIEIIDAYNDVSKPIVNGSAQTGLTLTGFYKLEEFKPDAQPVLNWYRGLEKDGSDKQVILQATTEKYTLTSADVGCYIFFEVIPVSSGERHIMPVVSTAHGPVTEQKALDFGTIGYIYRVLKNILTRATEWRMIASNPMIGIKKPTPDNEAKKLKLAAQKKNPQYYNEEEAQAVVDALYKESRKWRLFILGSMIGGFRRGELVGLEWTSVFLDDHSLSIENNIPLTENGAAVEKDPKSLSSIRNVDMPEWYMDELKLFREEWEEEKETLGDKWIGEDRQFVFHNGTGKPYYYKHPSRWWERFCGRRGLRYIKFHGLRHSMGTLLIEDETEGQIDPLLMAIQKRLGHSRLSTTTDIYVHVTKKVKSRTTGKFDKFARNHNAPAEPSEPIQVDPPRLVRIK